ncbi:hypothetical protein [Sphingomonas crusticola]|uniref:hypothetical protein n=1 Tax=Sphingomonas crusticola TaxID=1697973 RepID=UPI000E243F20|nr:hypothetical protein [Sphingomonas crusticola]
MVGAAKRRYRRSFVALSLIYLIVLVGVDQLFRDGLLDGAAAYVAAILPALPIIAMFAAIGRYLTEEDDEFVRLLMVRQTLVSCGFALSVATIWGFLDSFGLVSRADAHWVGLAWFAGLGVGAVFNRATNRAIA